MRKLWRRLYCAAFGHRPEHGMCLHCGKNLGYDGQPYS